MNTDEFSKTKSELDTLFEDVLTYRSSEHYRSLLEFCRQFKYLAPFNAMMVQMQRPGSQYVLTSKEWKTKYNRRIIPNARPVVILSFQPVSYLFELSDTEPIDETSTPEQKILEMIRCQYDTKNKVTKEQLDILIENLSVVGIAFNDKFRAGVDYSAQIELLDNPRIIRIPYNKNKHIHYESHYLISVNESSSRESVYAAVLHELAHFFCRHLQPSADLKNYKCRNLPKNAKEFEAESVAWLLCERLNLDNPSEKYLVNYLDNNENIPEGISVDHIFKAHNEIWKLLFERLNAKNNFLYKHCPSFKEEVDNANKNGQPKKSVAIQQQLPFMD